MAITTATVQLSEERLADVQRHLRDLGLGGWLLYDFRGANPIASAFLGLPALTRRYFVLIPTEGRPIAITHRIEQQPWRGWIGENHPYLSWQSLESELARHLRGRTKVALERSLEDAVPYVDRVPAGVLELIEKTGATTVSSADLVSALYSRWSAAEAESHWRAARILHQVVHEAFSWLSERLGTDRDPVTEYEVRAWIVSRLDQRGLGTGADAVVAVNANAANPHYAPSAQASAAIRPGDLILVDLWGKEGAEAVYADQTWMAYAGEAVPDRFEDLWHGVRDARDAAIDFIRRRWNEGRPVAGFEVDDAARSIITERGFGDAFIHRTGHSIDRELHGSGPNIDNLETRDTRRLIEGVGFSIEPGIYLPGEVGLRSEVDVFMRPEGPVITTPDPQKEIYRIRTGA